MKKYKKIKNEFVCQYILYPYNVMKRCKGITILSIILLLINTITCICLCLSEKALHIVVNYNIKITIVAIIYFLSIIAISKLIQSGIEYSIQKFNTAEYHYSKKRKNKREKAYIKINDAKKKSNNKDLQIIKESNGSIGTVISISIIMLAIPLVSYNAVPIETWLFILSEILMLVVAIIPNINKFFKEIELQ